MNDKINQINIDGKVYDIQSENDHVHNNKDVLDEIVSKNDNKQYVIKNGALHEASFPFAHLHQNKALLDKVSEHNIHIHNNKNVLDKIQNKGDGKKYVMVDGEPTQLNIETNDIADNAITENKLDDESVTQNKIGAGAVGTAELENKAVTSEKIADSVDINTKITVGYRESHPDDGSTLIGTPAYSSVTNDEIGVMTDQSFSQIDEFGFKYNNQKSKTTVIIGDVKSVTDSDKPSEFGISYSSPTKGTHNLIDKIDKSEVVNNYVAKTDFANTLKDYTTNDSLSETLKDYTKKSDVYPTNTISDYPIHITDHLVNEKYKSLKIWGTNNKNLIAYPYTHTTKTENGITFTDNGDGTITANGTATADANFYVIGVDRATLERKKYYFSCLTQSGVIDGATKIVGVISGRKDGVMLVNAVDVGDGVAIDMTNKDLDYYACYIRIKSGTTVNNLVFKPQLEFGTQATEFVKGEKLLGSQSSSSGKWYIPLRNTGKNLLSNPRTFTTVTKDGVTFTDNNDGTYSVSGTSTSTNAYQEVNVPGRNVNKKTMCLSGCPTGGSKTTYELRQLGKINNATASRYDTGQGVNINNFDYISSATVHIYNGTTVNNLTFKPQLEFGTQATSFEKGFETICSIQLDEPLGYGQYVDVINKKLYKGNSVQDVSIIGELIAADSEANNIVCNTIYAPYKIEVEYWQDIKKVIRDLQNAILSLGGNT